MQIMLSERVSKKDPFFHVLWPAMAPHTLMSAGLSAASAPICSTPSIKTDRIRALQAH